MITEQHQNTGEADSETDLRKALNILKQIRIVGVMLNGNINCEYTNQQSDVIRFKWSSSQSLMAAYINTLIDSNPAKPH